MRSAYFGWTGRGADAGCQVCCRGGSADDRAERRRGPLHHLRVRHTGSSFRRAVVSAVVDLRDAPPTAFPRLLAATHALTRTMVSTVRVVDLDQSSQRSIVLDECGGQVAT